MQGSEVLFVADSGNHCIRAVSTEGALGVVKTVFGEPEIAGDASTQFNFPWSICYHGSLLYVGDKYNVRIVILSPDDVSTVRILSDAWPWAMRFAPRGFASNADGHMFMTSSFGGMIWKYEPPVSMELLFGEREGKVVLPEKIAGSGLRSYRDGRAEFSEFMFPSGIAVDRNGSLLIADHGNSVLRRVRTLRDAEVKAKLRKMLDDMNNRGVRVCYQLWSMNVGTHEPLEPLEVVTLLALGTLPSPVASQHSPLAAFFSRPPPPFTSPRTGLFGGSVVGSMTNESKSLHYVVKTLATILGWRVVKSRQEVVAHDLQDDNDPPVITPEVRHWWHLCASLVCLGFYYCIYALGLLSLCLPLFYTHTLTHHPQLLSPCRTRARSVSRPHTFSLVMYIGVGRAHSRGTGDF